jgi:hypothetical protein
MKMQSDSRHATVDKEIQAKEADATIQVLASCHHDERRQLRSEVKLTQGNCPKFLQQ